MHGEGKSGAERRAEEIWSNLFVDVLNVSIRRGRLSAFVDSVLYALELVSPLLVLAVGATLVLDGRLTLGEMLAVAALAIVASAGAGVPSGLLGATGAVLSASGLLLLLVYDPGLRRVPLLALGWYVSAFQAWIRGTLVGPHDPPV